MKKQKKEKKITINGTLRRVIIKCTIFYHNFFKQNHPKRSVKFLKFINFHRFFQKASFVNKMFEISLNVSVINK